MNKKTLYKIRLRPDGTWENVYTDGSSDQEFYQTNGHDLARLHEIRREIEREEQLKRNALMVENFIEQALEYSDLRESKIVIDHIMRMK